MAGQAMSGDRSVAGWHTEAGRERVVDFARWEAVPTIRFFESRANRYFLPGQIWHIAHDLVVATIIN